MRRTEDGGAEGVTKPYCYHIHMFEELRPVLLDVVDYGQRMGLDMSYGDHEDAPGQLELNFRFDRPVRTADNITTYRQIIAAVGRKHGLLGSFMPKPFTGVSANGHHHHFTLVDDDGQQRLPRSRRAGAALRDGAPLPRRHARPLRGPDVRRQPDGQLLLPDVGHRVLGPDLQELGLAEPHLHRAGRLRRAVRVPRRRLVLQPVPDGRGAAAGRARRDQAQERPRRLRRRATPTTCSPRGSSSSGSPTASARRSTRWRPTRSSRGAMPGRLYKVFEHYKRDEWERYLAAVTDWEREEYLEVLP